MTITLAELQNYQAPDGALANRVILITGAGDGIGRALAIQAAKLGATIILLGRTTRKLEQVYDEIKGYGAPEPALYPMNLEGATMKDFEDLAEILQKEFGKLDGLVHNAALGGLCSSIDEYDPQTWLRVMHVNTNAAFGLSHVLLPLMKQSDDASVVFSSETVGRNPRAYRGAFAVSKAAQEALMKIMADELHNSNVRANSVDVGPVCTKLRQLHFPGEVTAKLPQPMDASVVNPFLYLLTADSKAINGQAL